MADAFLSTAFNCVGTAWPYSPSNVTFDDSGDGLAWVFQSETADPITHLGYRYGARTGTPPTYIASLQTPTAAGGVPDGTVLGGGSPASVTFTPPADTSIDGLWQWQTLANAYTPARGEFLALCLEYSSGTIGAGNCSSFTRGFQSVKGIAGLPYSCTKTGGTWAKSTSASIGFGYRTSSGRFGIIVQAEYNTSITTSGHRAAMKFSLPAGWGDTFKLVGFRAPGRIAGSGSVTGGFGLWDSAGTALVTMTTVDSDMVVNPAGGNFEFAFPGTPPTLNYGTDYYVGFQRTGSNLGVFGATLGSADDRLAYPNGTNRCLSTWNGSAWSDTTTVMPWVELIFADITEPSGGGSSGGGGDQGLIIQARQMMPY